MTIQEKTRWKNWADGLRQEMMSSLTSEVTKSVDVIISETATKKPYNTLRSQRFWRSCQVGNSPNDCLAKAGFELEFQPDEGSGVREVTLRLNETWMRILRGVLQRKTV